MKIFRTLFWTAIVAIVSERCTAEFLLVDIDDTAEKGIIDGNPNPRQKAGSTCGKSCISSQQCSNGKVCRKNSFACGHTCANPPPIFREDNRPCTDYYHCESELAYNPDACKHPGTKRLCPISCGCKKCNNNGCVMD